MIKQYWKFILIGFSLLVVLIIYGTYDPTFNSFFPKCPFLALTGYQCIGCGAQRATHHLINGEIQRAFEYNPLFVTLLPYIFIGLLFEFSQVDKKFPKLQRILFGYKSIYIVLGLIILFWIYRIIRPSL